MYWAVLSFGTCLVIWRLSIVPMLTGFPSVDLKYLALPQNVTNRVSSSTPDDT